MLRMDGRIYNTRLRFFEPESTKTDKDLQRSLMQNSFAYLPQMLQILIINFLLPMFHKTHTFRHLWVIQVNEKFRREGPLDSSVVSHMTSNFSHF